MAYESGYVDGTRFDYSRRYQLVEMFALSALGFLIPVTFGHPQLLVGIIVNAFIIRAAFSLPKEKALPMVISPALGAIARGMLFGPFTLMLVYMLPFIWAGNYILMQAFRTKVSTRFGFLATLAGASVAKTGLLFTSAYVLYSAGLVPALILTAMGSLQLVTALAGGILVFGELKAERYFLR